MQPLIILALVGVAGMAMGTGFLTNTFNLNVQDLGVAETNLASPIDAATIDLVLSKVKNSLHDGGAAVTHFHNVIKQCSFHSPSGLGAGSTIICKLTDADDNVIAEGKTVLAAVYDGSGAGFLITIGQTAFHLSNDVQEVHDVKIVVLAPKPAAFE